LKYIKKKKIEIFQGVKLFID